jgi:succinyl-diaminopimelate desuccinylase
MYGRGTEDDKGPTIAAYYALKILKELNVPLSKRVKLILGNDEETAWRCVRHYFSVYPEAPVSGFIPDADFPLIYAEKGISRIFVDGNIDNGDIVEIKGGFRDNMVPDYASAVLKPNKNYVEAFQAYLKKNSFEGHAELKDGNVLLKVVGKSAHGSTPQFGENAIDRLFEFFIFAGIDDEIVRLAQERLIADIHGKKLGVNYRDEEMGDLTINLGAMSTENGKYRFNLNLRYPNGVDFDQVVQTINENVAVFDAKAIVDNHQELLYVDPKSDLVQNLLKVYRKHTNDMTEPITIGGGTFARALPNSVAFGPHFLDKPTYIHQKNEFIDLDDFFKAIIIYTEALYELAK